ncbi:MAG: VanZ family protein [Acidobacteria bacterium]|nr:VanZ family protein [Acidobacteriota bacterium]
MPEARSPTPEATPIRLWLPVLAYMAVIFGLSSISHTPAMPGGSDKVLHTLLYSGLGLLFARALSGGRAPASARVILIAAIFGALYGASDELHQYFNPPRSVEVADVMADTIGSALGAAALYAWGIIRGRDGL